MSGHSKWSTIKRDKEKEDAKRGVLFSKHAKEIIVAAKLGGGDPDNNARLRRAIKAAKDISMPKDKINSAIKRGTGEIAGQTYEDVVYEGYGPGGVAILVEALTDNKIRTVAKVRLMFQKAGGNLGEKGSVGWMFSNQHKFIFRKEELKQKKLNINFLEELAIDAGANDVDETAENVFILTSSQNPMLEKLQAAGYSPADHIMTKKPSNEVALKSDKAQKVLKLIESLKSLDDVQKVYSNFSESL